MTERPDLPGEMTHLLDDDTVNAILTGEAHGSVPAEFARVAELARAARVNAGGAAPAVSEQETEFIASIAAAVRRGSAWNSTKVVPLARRRRRGTAAGLAVFAAVTLSAGAAAAATNHLPPTLQDALSNAASHVGVHLPTADAGSDQPASTPPATEEVPQHNVTPPSSASAADNAPPAVTPASSDGAPGNSAHDRSPGDVASEAHVDNPTTVDDTHARSGDHSSSDSSSDSTDSTDSSSSDSTQSDGSDTTDSSTESDSGHSTDASTDSTHSDLSGRGLHATR